MSFAQTRRQPGPGQPGPLPNVRIESAQKFSGRREGGSDLFRSLFCCNSRELHENSASVRVTEKFDIAGNQESDWQCAGGFALQSFGYTVTGWTSPHGKDTSG
jgi:hypothetical protein